MHTRSSARRACKASRSVVEQTATVAMPSSRQARSTRSAISPRLAIRIFRNTTSERLDQEERLPELDGPAVLDHDLRDAPAELGLDLVHHLQRLDHAEHLSALHDVADLDEGRCFRRGGAMKRPDHRGSD